jgi:hypothetical protein
MNTECFLYVYLQEDMIDSKKKKERKKKTKAAEEAEELEEVVASLPKPTILGLWPFRLPVFIFWCLCNVPSALANIREEIAERRRQKEEEEEDDDDGCGERGEHKTDCIKLNVCSCVGCEQ